MSALKHTPGPWKIERGHGTIIKSIGPCVPDEYAGSAWLEVSEKDARLIAAAPDLLKVLRMARAKIAAELQVLVMSHTRPDGLIDGAEVVLLIEAEQDLVNQIDAAIAKAEGYCY